MSKLESPKVDPKSYYILEDIDITEKCIYNLCLIKCILKIGFYKRNGFYCLRVHSPDLPFVFVENQCEVRHGEEHTYNFISESILYFYKHHPELFNNLGGFNNEY